MSPPITACGMRCQPCPEIWPARGHQRSVADWVTACCALRVDAVVMTLGQHFHSVRGITAVDRLV